MSTPVVDPSDLALFLDIPYTDPDVSDRMLFLIGLAQELCETIVTPCPVTARSVVLGVIGRAWDNARGVESEGTGPYSVNFGAIASGFYLTKQDRATLKRIAGRGGAFSIDPTPADAFSCLPPWDRNYRWLGEFVIEGN